MAKADGTAADRRDRGPGDRPPSCPPACWPTASSATSRPRAPSTPTWPTSTGPGSRPAAGWGSAALGERPRPDGGVPQSRSGSGWQRRSPERRDRQPGRGRDLHRAHRAGRGWVHVTADGMGYTTATTGCPCEISLEAYLVEFQTTSQSSSDLLDNAPQGLAAYAHVGTNEAFAVPAAGTYTIEVWMYRNSGSATVLGSATVRRCGSRSAPRATPTAAWSRTPRRIGWATEPRRRGRPERERGTTIRTSLARLLL